MIISIVWERESEKLLELYEKVNMKMKAILSGKVKDNVKVINHEFYL